MGELTADRYAEFVHALHGHDPFPWQQQLAEHVLTGGRWPAMLDVPTGLGKTSVVDLATYAAARGSGPRRVFFVVDRRVVVDEAFQHSRRVLDLLSSSGGGILREVAGGLRGLAAAGNDQPPGTVIRMRGGVSWDWRWLDRPDRFGIVTSTVDQVGSRLLFRGYGLSRRLAPIDAALVGTDSVLFVDEAHLAEPFLQTVRAIQALDTPAEPVASPTEVVQLSATARTRGRPTTPAPAIFDLTNNLAHAEAGRRLRAAKTLVTARCPDRRCVDVLTEAALLSAQHRPGGLIAVVANTVARARAVFARIRDHLNHLDEQSGRDRGDATAASGALDDRLVLLTGRSRPWDRDRLLGAWSEAITVGWRNRTTRPTRFVVATQTIECGANLDFDMLITESAPWDALVQRLGRLNRVGHPTCRGATAIVVHAITTQPDPVYGPARDTTWQWLAQATTPREWSTARAVRAATPVFLGPDGLDVSPAALRTLPVPPTATSDPPAAPHLCVQHLDGWSRTAPIPEPDTPIEAFLHGFSSPAVNVRVAWRADLPADLPIEEWGPWQHTVEVIPPRAEEILEIPLAAVRQWLDHAPPDTDITDLGHDQSPPDGVVPTASRVPPRQRGAGRPALVLRADEPPRVAPSPARLQPDDLLVVPAAYGGLDAYGWAPTETQPVLDIADLAGRAPVLRLSARTLPAIIRRTEDPGRAQARADTVAALLNTLDQHLATGDVSLPARLPVNPTAGTEPVGDTLAGTLAALGTELAPWWRHLRDRGWVTRPLPTTPRLADADDVNLGVVLVHATASGASDTASDSSSVSDAPVGLARHHTEVRDLAKRMAARLLPADLVTSVALGAGWHDLGKLDPRFQALLHHGSTRAAEVAAEPLAKSGIAPTDLAERRRAARASGYPRGARHEALSGQLARQLLADQLTAEIDHDLVIHLVSAHHGHSRPLLPAIDDPAPPSHLRVPAASAQRPADADVDLPDSSTVDIVAVARFHRLRERYGIWGLALLETMVRMADIACSAGEHTIPAREGQCTT